jgi:hypothetical protein
MRKIIALVLLAICGGCIPVNQDSVRTVAAIEVVLATPSDRTDLVAMMRRHASARGLHIDDDSQRWREFEAHMPNPPPVALRKTIYVGVWRGVKDDDPEVFIDDGGHQGRAWITFLQGKHPQLAGQVRRELLQDINRRWPEARPLPVLPSGGLSLARDLRLTADGYKIARSASQDYDLSPSSPLLTPG